MLCVHLLKNYSGLYGGGATVIELRNVKYNLVLRDLSGKSAGNGNQVRTATYVEH